MKVIKVGKKYGRVHPMGCCWYIYGGYMLGW